MARRGPDDEGSWVAPGGRCTLVFRRLSILDLSPAGHQPMLAGDGRYALVFNGEIYNFRELRRELERLGARFRSGGDAEVVLQSLVHWGDGAFARFNGMFAIAFYDARAGRLLLARDHAGIKPLYVLRTPQGVAFASQYDQLLAHPWSAACGISRAALAAYLRIAFVPAPLAMLEHTQMLEPGAWYEFGGDARMRSGRHFELAPPRGRLLSGEEAVERVDGAVASAVRRQLVSDVPVAAFLSGGIDSPLVVAKMRHAVERGLRAFTIGTGGDATDESTDAIAYARELGVDHVVEQAAAEDAVGLIDEVIGACGEPLGDYSMFPTMLVSRLAAREFKVVLSGDGGDELFWGYPRRMAALIRHAQDFERPYPLRVAEWALRRATGSLEGHEHIRIRSPGAWHRARHLHLGGGWLERVFPTLPPWPNALGMFDYAGSDRDATAQWLRRNEFDCHLTMVLLKVDRASMHYSLEVRVPLLDKEVIAAALDVDWRACLDLDQEIGKLPLRKALAREVRHQTTAKRGFEVPMGKWLRTSLRDVFEDAVLSRDEILGLPLDRTSMRALFDLHLSGKVDYGWGLWPILSLSLWERRHLAARSRAA
jgi:asparagine synthase (glutamine-hydrolysing)